MSIAFGAYTAPSAVVSPLLTGLYIALELLQLVATFAGRPRWSAERRPAL